MAVLTTPCPALFPTPPPALPDRLALDAPGALACFAPRVGQSEQVTCPRAPCRLVAAWRPLARHQRRLLRTHGAAETGEAFRQDCHHPAGLGFARTADDAIIGKVTQKTSALHPGGDVLAKPRVQDMRQESIGEHGRNAPAWRRTLVGVPPHSRLPHTRVQPLAKQSASASIPDSLLEKLPQMAPVHVVETSPNLRLDSPVDGPRPTLLPPLMQRLIGTVALPEAMGEGMPIRFDDGFQDPRYRPLDPLVLAAGLPSWPLLPLVLLAPHPFDGRCHRPLVAEPLLQVTQVVVQVLSRRRGRPLVSPRCPMLAGQPLGFAKEVVVDHVTHVVAHHRWRALCLLRNALEVHGDGWRARRLSPRSLQTHVLPGVAFPPVGPVGRGSPPSPVLCAATTPPCPSRVASLLARFPRPRLLHGVRGVLIRLVAGVTLPGHARALGRPVPHSGSGARRQGVLPRARATPVQTCPALRPRWGPAHWPYRPQDCCLPALAHRRRLPRYRCGSPAVHDSPDFGAPSRGLPPRSLQLRTPMAGRARGVRS
jgi:hypothetical protein